jgi:hypothetical protein
VTAARLGASRWPAQAFRCAVFSYMLRWPVRERDVIDAIWNGGHWREPVAEYADEPLDLADRLTGEGDSASGQSRSAVRSQSKSADASGGSTHATVRPLT